jgi:hypothetical protein
MPLAIETWIIISPSVTAAQQAALMWQRAVKVFFLYAEQFFVCYHTWCTTLEYLKAWGVTSRIVLMANELFIKILKGFTSLVSLHKWTDHPWPLQARWKPIGAPRRGTIPPYPDVYEGLVAHTRSPPLGKHGALETLI